MLGRSERESPAHAVLAARMAGWNDPVELLDLGTTADTLATVASIEALAAVVHLGHPEHPAPGLERALLEGASSLIVTAAVAVPGQWVWVGAGATVGQVVIDEAGMRDCAGVLRGLGVSPRLVPTRAGVEERIALAGEGGSLVIERSRVPAGFAELPDSAALAEGGPVWYGLLESRDDWPQFTSPRRCGSRSARPTTTSAPCSPPSRSSPTPGSTWTTCAASRRRAGPTCSSRRSPARRRTR